MSISILCSFLLNFWYFLVFVNFYFVTLFYLLLCCFLGTAVMGSKYKLLNYVGKMQAEGLIPNNTHGNVLRVCSSFPLLQKGDLHAHSIKLSLT